MTYRKNKFNISNNLNVNITNGNTGAWGSFSEFVNANPYYPVTNEDGTIPRGIWMCINVRIMPITATNPYYNAMLPSENRS